MQITKPPALRSRIGKSPDLEVSISEAVLDTITNNPYDDSRRGAVEDLGVRLGNVAGYLGELTTILAEKGILLPDDVSRLIGYPFKVLP